MNPDIGERFIVDLETATGHDVSVRIRDRSEIVVDADSGPASAGASVEPGRIRVENVDARTLRLTWVDRPGDNELSLGVIPKDGKLDLVLYQPEQGGDGDAIAHDRSLVLRFESAVDAADVVAVLTTDTDAINL